MSPNDSALRRSPREPRLGRRRRASNSGRRAAISGIRRSSVPRPCCWARPRSFAPRCCWGRSPCCSAWSHWCAANMRWAPSASSRVRRPSHLAVALDGHRDCLALRASALAGSSSALCAGSPRNNPQAHQARPRNRRKTMSRASAPGAWGAGLAACETPDIARAAHSIVLALFAELIEHSRRLDQAGKTMAKRKTPLTGGCQCGAVRYAVSSDPVALYICHCRECRKQSAGLRHLVLCRSKVWIHGSKLSKRDCRRD